MKRILVVEDSVDIQDLFKSTLEGQYQLDFSATRSEAFKKLSSCNYDLIILDVALEDGTGFQLCAQLKNLADYAHTPVVFVSGNTELEDKVMAFSLGAADYVVKPFEPLELKMRIEARLRTAGTDAMSNDIIRVGDFRINRSLQKIHLLAEGRENDLRLTPIEFKILYFLAKNSGKVFSRDDLMTAIWSTDVHVVEDNIYTHISALRKKLGPYSSCIESVPKQGYRFTPNPQNIF